MKEQLIFEYSKITPHIYIGTNQCCQINFKESLIKRGIKADISLEEERIDHPFGVDYYLWLPTKDHYPPSMKQLIIGVKFIGELVQNNIEVFVHCKYGHTRAPTLVAAYFMSQGLSVEEAIVKIKAKRPAIHITPRQKKALKKFKTYFKNYIS